jgi:hypothetical protein
MGRVRSNSRASRRQKRKDPDYVYDTPVQLACIASVKNDKKRIKRLKQREMKANPETLYVDYGEGYGMYGQSIDSNQSADLQILDVQFYTSRPSAWVRASMSHLQDQYARGEVPSPPEMVKQGVGNQIKIKQTDSFVNFITIFIYNSGTVLIQGASFESWCNTEFVKVLSSINSTDGSKPTANTQATTEEVNEEPKVHNSSSRGKADSIIHLTISPIKRVLPDRVLVHIDTDSDTDTNSLSSTEDDSLMLDIESGTESDGVPELAAALMKSPANYEKKSTPMTGGRTDSIHAEGEVTSAQYDQSVMQCLQLQIQIVNR